MEYVNDLNNELWAVFVIDSDAPESMEEMINFLNSLEVQ